MGEQMEAPAPVADVEKECSFTSEDAEEEEDTFFQDISVLENHAIPAEHVKKLKSVGLNTVKSLQMIMRKKLAALTGFKHDTIEQIKEAATLAATSTGFMTAMEFSKQRKQIFRISTGSSSLDKLLGGGIESMSITEVFGEFRTGKTQLSHTLCATVQMPGPGNYIGGKVMFIDTEHTFRPDRLCAIYDRFSLDQSAALENVLYARAYNSEHQYELLNAVATKFHDEAGVFKLLIIDSIMALFRVDFGGMSEIARRQQKLGQMLARLQKISEEFNVAVFITNQIASDLSKCDQPEALKPIGGNVLAHASTTRVFLRKGEGEKRIATMYDSPDVAEGEATFVITAGGIDDC